MAVAETTPVTLLTGFLGAGKTTLLNRLLQQPELARAAVLVNEFGEIGIDHLLVRKLDDNTVLLNAGCLCCSVRGDLVRALREMLPRARRGDICRVLIETTGLANPMPILATLLGDPVITAAYHLDGVVTVVDAVNGPNALLRHREAARQVAVADRIILTKSDLADLAALRQQIRALNPAAPLSDAVRGDIDPALLLGAGLFEFEGKPNAMARWLEVAAMSADAHEDGHTHHHDASIRAVCLSFRHPLDWPALATALGGLLAEHGPHVLRIKGVVNLRDHVRPAAIHAAGHLLHLPALLPAWPEGDPRTSRIVFIVDGLPPATIEAAMGAFQPDTELASGNDRASTGPASG